MLENLVNDLKTLVNIDLVCHMVYLAFATIYAGYNIHFSNSRSESLCYKALLYGSITGSCCTAMFYNTELLALYLAICAIVVIALLFDMF